MSILKADLIQNRAGTRPPGVTAGDFVKAFANVNQSGTQAIVSSLNISSITDAGLGLTTVAYSLAFSVAPANSAGRTNLASNQNFGTSYGSNSVGSCAVGSYENGAAADSQVYAVMAGVLA